MRSVSRDHMMESGLSRQSALNDRYFEKENTRSRSLDNLLSPVSLQLITYLIRVRVHKRARKPNKLSLI